MGALWALVLVELAVLLHSRLVTALGYGIPRARQTRIPECGNCG